MVMTEKAYVATVYLLLHGKSEAEMCDAVSELLSGATATPEHSHLIDWGYARAGGKWLYPAEVPGICLKDYSEGDFLPSPRPSHTKIVSGMKPVHRVRMGDEMCYDFEHISTTLRPTDEDHFEFYYGFTSTIYVNIHTGRATTCYGAVMANLPMGLRDHDSGWTDEVAIPKRIFSKCMIDARVWVEMVNRKLGLNVRLTDEGEITMEDEND
jgi:hypothetical protein